METVGVAVKNLDNPSVLRAKLLELGNAHKQYELTDKEYKVRCIPGCTWWRGGVWGTMYTWVGEGWCIRYGVYLGARGGGVVYKVFYRPVLGRWGFGTSQIIVGKGWCIGYFIDLRGGGGGVLVRHRSSWGRGGV